MIGFDNVIRFSPYMTLICIFSYMRPVSVISIGKAMWLLPVILLICVCNIYVNVMFISVGNAVLLLLLFFSCLFINIKIITYFIFQLPLNCIMIVLIILSFLYFHNVLLRSPSD